MPTSPSLPLCVQHLLIPLNACRHDTFYMPWRCGPERHAYEKCQYVEHLRTVKAKLEG
jgi:NADH dehydrogenase (ubiquinone) 1 beta subcomplex subunit 7